LGSRLEAQGAKRRRVKVLRKIEGKDEGAMK